VSTPPIDRAVFDRMYDDGDDPWGFTTSAYEARKRRITVASLPRDRYASGFEPGCSNGLLSLALAARCDGLLACDLSPRAIELARTRVGTRESVRFEQREVPSSWPDGQFDLIVVSELAYFLTLDELVVQQIAQTLQPGGDLIAVHWLGRIDGHPLDARAVHERLERGPWRRLVQHLEPEFLLQVFRA
jgi:SAM-dependent methyltransferase